MYLIAGLGNPGDKYKLTRHNIGFLVIDGITKNLSTSKINNTNFRSEVLKSNSDIFAKPQTFMNNSGESIINISNYYSITNDKIIVIHDDLDLPFGTIKFKLGGGHGGHNGLKSIDANIGNDYIRIRIGIGKPENKSDVANYVLSNFSKDEQNKIDDIINHCQKAIDALHKLSIDEVKSKYTFKI